MTATAEPQPTTTASATPTLEIARRLRRRSARSEALTEVDFEVRSGEVMALVGDNGAGKSTLIKCIAGIYAVDCGSDVVRRRASPRSSGPKEAIEAGDRGRLPGPRAVRQPRRRSEHVPRPRRARAGSAGCVEAPMEKAHRRDALAGLRVSDDPLDSPARGEPLGRSAPICCGDRPRRDVELARRDPRRADGRTRRRPDLSRCSSSYAGCASRGWRLC